MRIKKRLAEDCLVVIERGTMFITEDEEVLLNDELYVFILSEDKARKYKKTFCEECNNPFYIQKSWSHKYRFCSDDCRHGNKRVELECYNCGKIFIRSKSKLRLSKSKIYFCSRDCKDFQQSLLGDCKEIRPEHYGQILKNYRKTAKRNFEAKCSRCGYSEMTKMLDVHHIDGNRENNSVKNLEFLCVWCHGLETRKNWENW